jgi:hypothetical protein
MIIKTSGKLLFNLVAVAILSSGFAPFAFAGPIDTAYLIEADDRSASLDRIQVLLAQDAVTEQLQKFGVDEAAVVERLQSMTAAELVALEGQLENGIAGGSAVGIIGAVFLVLIILELVGITDIFKAF